MQKGLSGVESQNPAADESLCEEGWQVEGGKRRSVNRKRIEPASHGSSIRCQVSGVKFDCIILSMADSGYSGTPLVKKLGLKSPLKLLTINAPKEYKSWLGDLPNEVKLLTKAQPPIEAAHVFATESAFLDAQLSQLRTTLKQDGFVWVSWPKKSAKVSTDITEDTIREIALPLGFVDIKVCAVSEVWSGLKLVIRKSERRA